MPAIHKKLEYVIPDIHKWPIVKLTSERDEFIEEVVKESRSAILPDEKSASKLNYLLEQAVYLEKIRLTEKPWKVDPPDEENYWDNVQKQLLKISTFANSTIGGMADKSAGKRTQEDWLEKELLDSILRRYTNEVAGRFDVTTFRIAKNTIPLLFSRLLNTASNKTVKRLWGDMSADADVMAGKKEIRDRITVYGDIPLIRKLATKGTVVLVPTHFSNLDPFLVGYAIDAIGLPPFLYGAGFNLYNNPIEAFFFNRLGAYKVDRRKKNLFYLETLKSYSRIAIEKGCHSLFFPGGTRSRSGSIEKKLKLGLLGTAIDAQRYNFQNNPTDKAGKIFVLPLVISYHFVLEASGLIEEHLKSTGREKYYIENDPNSSLYKIGAFLWNFITRGSTIALSYGKPTDLFGFEVDEEGRSVDKNGSEVNIRDYFVTNGEIKSVPQRDEEYTRLIGQNILDSFHKYNIVFTSHLVAFAAFEMLRKKFPSADIYALLRLPEEYREIPYTGFAKTIERLREQLRKMDNADGIISSQLNRDIDDLITSGIRNLGLYHPSKVLFKNKEGNVCCGDMKLLYFYHNRMDGYFLEKYI